MPPPRNKTNLTETSPGSATTPTVVLVRLCPLPNTRTAQQRISYSGKLKSILLLQAINRELSKVFSGHVQSFLEDYIKLI